MRVLVVNAGSSTVKLSLVGPGDERLGSVELQAPQARVDRSELLAALEGLGEADAVGHRIVHGGEHFRDAVRIDPAVQQELIGLIDLAPLHQPKSLAALGAVNEVLPNVPAIACFDTAFHATLPPKASTYAIPAELRSRWRLRRYGFHGLNHAWVARRAVELVPGARKVVSCHLGAGASLCAIDDGTSIDTTMGFTPLEGLVMATRSGNVDPGMLLWLLEREAMTERELAEALEHQSGLQALAGTADMRVVLERAHNADPEATLALQVYLHRLRAGIGAMAAALNGLDTLVFTGGVGERSPAIRGLACAGLSFLRVRIDPDRNEQTVPDADVSAASSPVSTLVIAAREDLEIARQVRAVCGFSTR